MRNNKKGANLTTSFFKISENLFSRAFTYRKVMMARIEKIKVQLLSLIEISIVLYSLIF